MSLAFSPHVQLRTTAQSSTKTNIFCSPDARPCIWQGHPKCASKVLRWATSGGRNRGHISVALWEPCYWKRRCRRGFLLAAYAVALTWCFRLWRWQLPAIGLLRASSPVLVLLTLHTLAVATVAASPGLAVRFNFRAAQGSPKPGFLAVLADEAGKEEIAPLVGDPRNHDQACLKRRELYLVARDGKTAEPIRPAARRLADYTAEGLASEEIPLLREIFGKNSYQVPVPALYRLVAQRLRRPVALFELVSVALWALDGYWQFMAFSIFSILSFEVFTAYSKYQSLTKLAETSSQSSSITVRRDNEWSDIDTEELLPGDVVKLCENGSSVVPCDLVLISGSVLVAEAALTGESVPQPKEAVQAAAEPERVLAPESVTDARCCLFAGTKIMQINGEMPALAVVLCTGFQTRQGQLMSRLACAQAEIHDGDTLRAIILLVTFAAVAAAYVLIVGAEAIPMHKRLVRAGVVMSFAVSPALPLLLTYAVQRTTTALNRRSIVSAEPYRVPEAGRIRTCLFDKTGTLTRSDLLLEGVRLPPGAGSPAANSHRIWETVSGQDAPLVVQQILGGCHTVVPVPPKQDAAEPELAGDPLEVASLRALGWTVKNEVSGPVHTDQSSVSVQVVRRFFFSPESRMMSVEALVTDATFTAEGQVPRCRRMLLTKGAPEAIQDVLQDLPSEYRSQHELLANEGLRVLSLAWKELGMASPQTRKEAESNLEFAGFACFAGEIRPEAAEVIQMLDAAGVTCSMVTGDALPTAVKVARETGLLKMPPLVLSDGQLVCEQSNQSFNVERHAELSSRYDLICTEGDLADRYWEVAVSARVLARMSPGGKRRVVELIRDSAPPGVQSAVMMVGDGGNDVGALQEAECGLALLPAQQTMTGEIQDNQDPLSWSDEEVMSKFREQERLKAQQQMAVRKIVTERVQQRLRDDIARRRERGQSVGPLEVLRLIRVWTKEEQAAQSPKSSQAESGCDASAAAAFAVRHPSLRAAPELLRQGQMTLASVVMQTQHLVLSTAVGMARYATLSAEGTNMSEIQMMSSDMFLTLGFLGFIGASVSRRPATTPPPSSFFEPAVFVSTIGQAILSVLVMRAGITLAKEAMGPVALSALLEFQRKVDVEARTWGFAELHEKAAAGMGMMQLWALMCRPFMPNPLNTIVYLLELSQRATAMFINYRGRPWMTGPGENVPLLAGTAGALLLVTLCAMGVEPLRTYLQLDVLSTKLQLQLVGLLVLSVFGSYAWDRIVFRLLAPKIYKAWSLQPFAGPMPTLRRAWPVAKKILIAVGIGFVVLSGNPVLWLMLLFWNLQRTRRAAMAPAAPTIVRTNPATTP